MRNHNGGSRSVVRPDWLAAVVAHSQAMAGQSHVINVEDIEPLMIGFVKTLPRPSSHLERFVLRGVLLDAAWQSGRSIHTHAHRTGAKSCAFAPALVLEHFWKAPTGDPCAGFIRWAHAFAHEFSLAHPPTPASRAAKQIREHFGRKWSVAALAKAVHATPSQLRRQFALDYGVSIRQYLRSVRMAAALSHMPRGKVDAIALEVGYRSRKNFNDAFRQVTGLTPTAFRLLSPEDASEVTHSIGRFSQTSSTPRKRHRKG